MYHRYTPLVNYKGGHVSKWIKIGSSYWPMVYACGVLREAPPYPCLFNRNLSVAENYSVPFHVFFIYVWYSVFSKNKYLLFLAAIKTHFTSFLKRNLNCLHSVFYWVTTLHYTWWNIPRLWTTGSNYYQGGNSESYDTSKVTKIFIQINVGFAKVFWMSWVIFNEMFWN